MNRKSRGMRSSCVAADRMTPKTPARADEVRPETRPGLFLAFVSRYGPVTFTGDRA